MQIILYSRDCLNGEPVNIDGVIFRAVWIGSEDDLPVGLEDFVDAEEAALVFAEDELQIGDVIKMDEQYFVRTERQWIEVNKHSRP